MQLFQSSVDIFKPSKLFVCVTVNNIKLYIFHNHVVSQMESKIVHMMINKPESSKVAKPCLKIWDKNIGTKFGTNGRTDRQSRL